MYIYDFRGISGVPGGMRLLNKIYGLVQAGRGLFNIFCDGKFEQSEADRHVFCKFDDEEVEVVVFMHADDILLMPERRWRGSLLRLEKRLK